MEYSAMSHRRILTRLLLVLFIVTMGTPELRAQESDTAPYFSLSSERTFKSGQQASIRLYATNVRELEFRVYRVKDPLQFFKQLEDPHNFGARSRPSPQNLTLIERYHALKRQVRLRLQNVFRAQYSPESRAAIRERMEKSSTPPTPARVSVTAAPGVQMYPSVPLLNPPQVVAVWHQAVSNVRRWDSQTIGFDVPGRGVYLVEATEGTLRAYTIVIVTDIAVVTKGSAGKVLAFTVDRATGIPLPDAEVTMILGGKSVADMKTDASGLAEMSLTAAQPESVLVTARKDDDFAVASEYGYSLSTDPERDLTGYLYTERPIYRPTHTVYFKGILRTMSGNDYTLPNRKMIDVEVRDPEGNPIFRKSLALSSTGTFHGDLTLASGAALGSYSIVANSGSRAVYGNFEVEEYKKPEYEVRVTPDKPRVLQGESITATIEARYFFGEPVTDARVSYVIHTAPYWYYPTDEEFDDEGSGEFDYGADQVDEIQGQLDSEGKLHISIPTKVSQPDVYPQDVRYRIEARVTDKANREISGASSVIATYASFTLNVGSSRYVHDRGSTGKFTVTAQDYDRHPIETDLRVELLRWSWQDKSSTVLWSGTARTGADGQAAVDVPFMDAGSFRVRVTAKSPEGRDVTDTAYAWVQGDSASWLGSGPQRIQIIPDKNSYAPGETARVLIVTGVPDAHVLVTTEGRALSAPQLIHATSATFMVDVPVGLESAPNFFVNALFLRDNEIYQGSKSIKVPPTTRQLNVEIQPSKNEFKPAEAATYSVTTKDSTGRPVSAEVSFGLVDEAIYAIRPDAAMDIMKFFYGTIYNRVSTTSSLSYYFNGSAGKRQMRLADVRPPSAYGQIKPEKLLQPKVRRAFPDTAIWISDLRTDQEGKATVRLTFPDALTTWRATARAVTDDTRVGSAVQKTIVRKNLILRLAVPRFFTQGDEVVVSVLVHNYLQNDKTARISLDVKGLQVLDGATKDVMIPSRSDARLDWKVKAATIGDVQLTGKALTDEESDAMEMTLPVIPFGVKLSTSNSGSTTETTEIHTTVAFPKNIDAASRSLEIGVTPSVAGAIFGGLDYLTSFPYGCTEQTMSSFLPNVVVANALKQLHVQSNVDEASLAIKLRDGLARLYQYQHEDGGWGWWETDESTDFMTAYVVAGLAQARDSGVNVEMARLERASKWLGQQFDASPRVVADLRAYVLYALSLSGNATPPRIESTWSQRGQMSPYGLAFLGLTLDRASDNRAEEVVNQLSGLAKVDDREAYWAMTRDPLMMFEYDTTSEATAYAVKLLVKRQPSSPLIPKAAQWLVAHRSEGFYWSSTKQTAMVIYGLTDYLKASGELKPDFSIQVWLNDQQILNRRFTAADALSTSPPVIRIPASALSPGDNRVRIVKNGTGMLYWNTRGEYYSAEDKMSRLGTVSLNLLRDYFRLIPERKDGKITYNLEPLDGPVKSGDVLAVRLTVSTGGTWNYLQIEDPVPAGTEFIERDDLYELKQKPDWWARFYARREFHDDRAAFFQTSLQGQAQHFYLLKVVNPGAFRTSAAWVQPMYQPQYLATTESRDLMVQQ